MKILQIASQAISCKRCGIPIEITNEISIRFLEDNSFDNKEMLVTAQADVLQQMVFDVEFKYDIYNSVSECVRVCVINVKRYFFW